MSLNTRITQWAGRTVWLIGASTGIGRATASQLHALGAKVIVSARSAQGLDAFVSEHPGSQALALDVTDTASVQAAAAQVHAQGGLDWVVYCAGHYREMRANAIDLADVLRHNDVNYLGAMRVLDAVTPLLLKQAKANSLGGVAQRGHISLMASVAGYRGLPKSLAYGPTKAALINLAETLYLDLHPQGVDVSLVNPGFVDTPLTAQNEFTMPALLTPAQAAQAIVKGWARGAFEIHFPKRFTLWLKVLRCLPNPVFFALMRRVSPPEAA
ncbi:SDR family NAD(P)-dependent oxidoreductase [Rhodoferax aquaticus]|uniref:SDR family NAD(P)-dependent oxidoreductase n=1 Tax=Rhodoferax aquaticus TaxID=2527691 RepID=A0A515EW80_9BURK|nr:SDR family NAD(P)-dependent oxidoreductase [Rhodoferax aquaticus]QDL56924.1 SDR family NAD(P)-dependent oxidoreductase [Rhodoferax aquaticus]